ncbi:2-haloacid dehalogenase [Deferribacter desulfuricans SSM1]|uniref:2-haloacid dehalogenase n=1 Tax=Deferribacter desulfuricans (strain DSM 14783 / JCM 11476 / NBRC 101012 / SSM1) TaxID=639282 RepID=D3PCQ8_DEFDS|nr:haloacid dehalogenase type II [Deferribacter desulfuricans]BAI80381.1 2-haloacid dehalogenase [Deferribacter desulfuricans SSM1]
MRSSKIIAFDIYGTLIDTKGIFNQILRLVKDEELALNVVDMWRQKQLEYSFRRGLMRNYVDFSICTKQALEYVIKYYNLDLSEVEIKNLLDIYKELPVFSDVKISLDKIKENNIRMYAFSNGKPDDLVELLKFNGIINYFDDIISVDPVKSFKPDPAVYLYLLRKTNGYHANVYMVPQTLLM